MNQLYIIGIIFLIFGIITIIYGFLVSKGHTFKIIFYRSNLKTKSKDELKTIGTSIMITGCVISIVSLIQILFNRG